MGSALSTLVLRKCKHIASAKLKPLFDKPCEAKCSTRTAAVTDEHTDIKRVLFRLDGNCMSQRDLDKVLCEALALGKHTFIYSLWKDHPRNDLFHLVARSISRQCDMTIPVEIISMIRSYKFYAEPPSPLEERIRAPIALSNHQQWPALTRDYDDEAFVRDIRRHARDDEASFVGNPEHFERRWSAQALLG